MDDFKFLSADGRSTHSTLEQAQVLCKMFKLDSKQHLIEMARLIQQERQGAIIEILRKAFVLTPHDVHPTALEAMAMALRDIATALYERGM